MSTLQHSLRVLVTLIALSLVAPASFAAESTTNDLNSYLCKDLMRLSGEDREIALALVHGYRLGKLGTTQFETDALAEITDRFLEYCLDHPGENALASFEKVAK